MSENIKQVNQEEVQKVGQNTEKLQETKNDWVKIHKKQLILAGVGITTIIGMILGIKNKDVLEAFYASLKDDVIRDPVEIPVAVPIATPEKVIGTRKRRHIRTMAVGKHHSEKKAAEAAALGIKLLPNQTLVNAYPEYASC